jgi:aarF domain-containing kinase
MLTLRRVVKYGFLGGSVLGTGISLHQNNYDISGIGVVRFARAGVALVEIATIYQRELYFREWDIASSEAGRIRRQQIVCWNFVVLIVAYT